MCLGVGKAATKHLQARCFCIGKTSHCEDAHGVAASPSAKRSKKMTLELNYTDDGPTVLGFRVQKLRLKDGELNAVPHVDGAYFGDEKVKRFVDFNAG
jgi:hypothetical protein